MAKAAEVWSQPELFWELCSWLWKRASPKKLEDNELCDLSEGWHPFYFCDGMLAMGRFLLASKTIMAAKGRLAHQLVGISERAYARRKMAAVMLVRLLQLGVWFGTLPVPRW